MRTVLPGANWLGFSRNWHCRIRLAPDKTANERINKWWVFPLNGKLSDESFIDREKGTERKLKGKVEEVRMLEYD